MADYVQVPPDSTGKKIDAVSLDVGANTVMRQRIVIADNSDTAGFAVVTGGALLTTGTFNLSAMPNVNVSAMPAITGTVNISGTALVAIPSVIATRTVLSHSAGVMVGTLNGISATVTVAGTVDVGALPANIGTLNDISRTVQVAISTPFTVNNISATVFVAGTLSLGPSTANIGSINNISATVSVVGIVNISATASVILAAGTANFGTLNDISRTVQVAVGTPFTVNNVSATVVVAGNVGLVSGATVIISGTAAVVLATGVNNIGALNHISRTVAVTVATPFTLNNISATTIVAGVVTLSGTGTVVVATGATADFNTLASADQVQTLPLFGFALPADGGAVAGGTPTNPISVLVENASATVSVVLAAGTANIGTVNDISRTVQVAVATPFTINNISATVLAAITNTVNVTVTGQISAALATGVNNIGVLNHISRTVAIAVSTPFTVNNISATAVVSGVVGLAAGAEVIGDINAISRTVQVAIGTPFTVNNISATVTAVIGNFLDPSGDSRNLVDSANLALRVNIVAGSGAGANPVSIAAGTSNIGFINHISATAVVAGVVGLTAGTAVIGDLNAISRTVQVAVGTPFNIAGVNTTVTVAGVVALGAGAENIGFINHISATAIVAGVVGLTAGAANIGFINHVSRTVAVTVSTPFTLNNISATVVAQVAGFTPAIMSASHGPKCVTASTSAVVTLIVSPGAGQSVHVTQLMVGNGSNLFTKARIGTSASAMTVVQPLAAAGGGFVYNFDPPWKLSASEAAICSVKPNASDVFFTVNFFVAP